MSRRVIQTFLKARSLPRPVNPLVNQGGVLTIGCADSVLLWSAAGVAVADLA
jgi:hypothetical protein